MADTLEKPDTAHIEKATDGIDTDEPLANPSLDRRLNRKFDLRILPWLFGIW